MKKELKILGLSYSQSQIGAYIVVLSTLNGNKKIPVIIKPTEAQRIALEVEGIQTPTRPVAYDIIKEMSEVFEIQIKEIYIYSLLEGIFYNKIILNNGSGDVEIECNIGDALNISLINKCPIYTTNDILNEVGLSIDNDGNPIDGEVEEEVEEEVENESMSINDLEQMIKDAISDEEYEIAAKLRDRIDELKNND